MTQPMAIFPRERIDFGRLGLPVAHLSRDQRDLLELLVTLYQQGRSRQRQTFLAAELHCSREHVNRLLKQLEGLGEIHVEREAGATNLYGPGDGKQLHWTDVSDRPLGVSGDESADDAQAGGHPVENTDGAVTDSHRGCDPQSQPPVLGPPPYTPSKTNSNSRREFPGENSGEVGSGAIVADRRPRTSRVERRELREKRQTFDRRTGLTLTRWYAEKSWNKFGPDGKTPAQRLVLQSKVSNHVGDTLWAWSPRDKAFRRIVGVALSDDGLQISLRIAPMTLDGDRTEFGTQCERRDFSASYVSSLMFWTDRWGNERTKGAIR